MVTLVNRAKVSTSTTGTGTITLAAAAAGYQTFADAGVTDGDVVRYIIEDGENWEIGTGTYTASGTTLSRTVSESSNADAAISLSGTATVFVGATAEDFAAPSGPALQAIASGALSDGSTVVINADGTVSVAAVSELDPPEVGMPVVFESASIIYNSITYDANTQKVVIAYSDTENSFFGTAVVGTVSGTSISFGTPVVLNSAQTLWLSATYHTNAQKVVIAFQQSGGNGTAIVGTVSGDSISFGTASTFEVAVTDFISIVYEPNADVVVIAYRDRGASNRGTATVGTVSGTSITFGARPQFETGATVDISATYDANAQKVVIAYRDGSNSNYGTAVVGTVSGTSISFGTPVVFLSSTTEDISVVYDSAAQKVVVLYTNFGTGAATVATVSGTGISFGSATTFDTVITSYVVPTYDPVTQKIIVAYKKGVVGNFVVGAVSGTTISFGSVQVFSSTTVDHVSITYDVNASSPVISYQDNGNAGFGTSVVVNTTAANLTAENFIGFSDAAYADTATATIQLVGAVDDAQTSLTAGQKYYVQKDGTLSTSPDTPSVYAGLAVASDKIIVKG